MKFVGKTSVAVIKSAILGGFENELFFRRGKREKGRRGGLYLCTTGTLRSSESEQRQSGLY